MAPMRSIYNSILYLLFHSQLRQPCFCVLVCLSDMEAFLEFSKQSESAIKESEGKTAVVSGYPSLFVS